MLPRWMPDLEGKTFLITGANTGIGRAMAQVLAGHGATVVLACRSEARTTQEGAQTSLYCATAAKVAGDSGCYYENARRKQPGPAATADNAAELWERSAAWVAS
jgi:NAD(P)-dependent dehydrogenase (short-subunit alcohol dehydrogenase family)